MIRELAFYLRTCGYRLFGWYLTRASVTDVQLRILDELETSGDAYDGTLSRSFPEEFLGISFASVQGVRDSIESLKHNPGLLFWTKLEKDGFTIRHAVSGQGIYLSRTGASH